MQRPIKFRAWDKVKRKMCVVDDICFATGIAFLGDLTEDTCYQANLSEIELLQYIELKDKQGKEIYGGDIVKGERLDHFNPNADMVEVYWEEGAWYPFADNEDNAPYPESGDVEVVGNIYENPEIKEVK